MNYSEQIKAIFLISILWANTSFGQNRERASQYIDTLCSERFAGRGYIDNGALLAADYIASEWHQMGLQVLSDDYFMPFTLDINTFPSVEVLIDGKMAQAGYDYLISPGSQSVDLEAKLFPVSMKMLHSKDIGKKARKAVKKGMIPVIPVVDPKDSLALEGIAEIERCAKAKVLIFLKEQLTWSLSNKQKEITEIYYLNSAFDLYAEDIQVKVTAQLLLEQEAKNVMAVVPGTLHPDSFIVLCGHYDHLGKMGDATFYGANDNASGIAMLLDMASYFQKNPQQYSLLFIAFGAEEAGLIGSYSFVKSPPVGFSLQQIKFVFNMDLMGSGEDGATIVNGRIFTEAFDQFVSINEKGQYLPKIKARGKAANSDHYFFSEIGIPAFFIYLMGDYTHYHIPEDKPENLQLTEYYDRSFKLIRDFIIALNVVN
jgi:hypothetical protein